MVKNNKIISLVQNTTSIACEEVKFLSTVIHPWDSIQVDFIMFAEIYALIGKGIESEFCNRDR